jgi:hypothetical protein
MLPIMPSIKFCIDVPIEMRTVLSEICLFIDNLKLSDNILKSNGDRGEESKIEEKQRESVCV